MVAYGKSTNDIDLYTPAYAVPTAVFNYVKEKKKDLLYVKHSALKSSSFDTLLKFVTRWMKFERSSAKLQDVIFNHGELGSVRCRVTNLFSDKHYAASRVL